MSMSGLHLFEHTNICACMYAHTHMCTHARTHTYVHACTHMCTHAHTYVHSAHTHTYMHIHRVDTPHTLARERKLIYFWIKIQSWIESQTSLMSELLYFAVFLVKHISYSWRWKTWAHGIICLYIYWKEAQVCKIALVIILAFKKRTSTDTLIFF